MHTEIFLNVIQKLSIAKPFSLFYSYQISLEQKLKWSMNHCFCYGLFMLSITTGVCVTFIERFVHFSLPQVS